jgi:hypothetical protein
MKTAAIKRLRRAQRRIEILKAKVCWWGRATGPERLAVLREVRTAYPFETGAAAVECNWFDSAAQYLGSIARWRRGPTAADIFGEAV